MKPVNVTANKAAAAISMAALIVSGSLLAYIALAIVLAIVGYDISAWRGALLMIVLLLLVTAGGMFIASAFIRSRLRRAREIEVLRAAEAANLTPAGGSPDQDWTAPLVLGVAAAAAIGPIRAARLGLRAYSLWTTVRALARQSSK